MAIGEVFGALNTRVLPPSPKRAWMNCHQCAALGLSTPGNVVLLSFSSFEGPLDFFRWRLRGASPFCLSNGLTTSNHEFFQKLFPTWPSPSRSPLNLLWMGVLSLLVIFPPFFWGARRAMPRPSALRADPWPQPSAKL